MAGARGVARTLKLLGVLLVVGAGTAACIVFSSGDGSAVVSAPSAADRQEVVAQLARATTAQAVCYGWQLTDGTGRTVSRGSNLGDTVPVDSDPGSCVKWVEVRAQVTYPPDSSEAEDQATVTVVGSPSLRLDPGVVNRLARLGLAPAAFVDDPGWAICRAVLALPLLVAEAGSAEPAPTPSGAPTSTPQALADPGSDFWRDRLLFILVAGGVALGGLLMLLIGIFERRAQRSAARRPVPAAAPVGPSGKPH